MAVVIPEDYAQVTLNWQNSEADRTWSTVLGVSCGSATAYNVADTMIAAWSAELAPLQDSSLQFTTCTVRLGPSTGPTPGLSVDVAVNVAGGDSMAGASANCALLVRKFTAFGGRANRGRNYWPGFLEGSLVDEIGRLDETKQAALQSAFISFFAALSTGNGGSTSLTPAVILHDETSPSSIPGLVASVSVERVIGSQRRRVRP
jgi:hypothetical protein